jgi:EamA domain-containing membrane protein RarD
MQAYIRPILVAFAGFWISMAVDLFMFKEPFSWGSTLTWLAVWTAVLIYFMVKQNRDARNRKW